MISVVSWNIMINKCVVGCRSNYHEEAIVPAFSFSTKHDDFKSKRVRFVKDRQPTPTLLFVSATWREAFKNMAKKEMRDRLINSLKSAPSIYPNSIQSSAFPKIQLSGASPRKWILQKDEYTDFVANETISTLNYITKYNCTAGLKIWDHTVLRRQVTNELHARKVSEYIRIDYKLYANFTSPQYHFHNGSSMNIIAT